MRNENCFRKRMKVLVPVCLVLTAAVCLCAVHAAAQGNVASAIESTWSSARTQIKQVVNNVVFPALDLILAVLFFAKVGLSYMDYRRSGHMDFTAPAILFATLLFTLTAPAYLWSIIG